MHERCAGTTTDPHPDTAIRLLDAADSHDAPLLEHLTRLKRRLHGR